MLQRHESNAEILKQAEEVIDAVHVTFLPTIHF